MSVNSEDLVKIDDFLGRAKITGANGRLFNRLVPVVDNPKSQAKVCLIIANAPVDINFVRFLLTGIFCVLMVQDSIYSKGTEDAEQAENQQSA